MIKKILNKIYYFIFGPEVVFKCKKCQTDKWTLNHPFECFDCRKTEYKKSTARDVDQAVKEHYVG